MALPISYYDIAESQQNRLLHTGYNYKGNIFMNSMSNFMFANPIRAAILANMEPVIYRAIQNVKTIKIEFFYAVPKTWNYFN